METTDKIFIENNICAIHDDIIRRLIKTEDRLIASGASHIIPDIEEIIDQVRLAKQKGIKIESRLKLYFYTIRSLGFARDRGWEDIEMDGNRLTIKTDSVKKELAKYEPLEGLNIL